ncbi:MAG: ABC transporter permease [Firmicutes bacterium]|nr:ABC transporter permease [Bacillota bacterium]
MNWRHIRSVWFKEMLDTIRDRRTLLAMVVIPMILMPAMVVGFPALIERQERSAEKMVSRIIISGQENAPGLVEAVKSAGNIAVVMPPGDPIQALKSGKVHLVVEIPPGFEERVAREETKDASPSPNTSASSNPNSNLSLRVLYEGTSRNSDLARTRFLSVFNAYSQQVVAMRLARRNIDPAILSTGEIETQNVASEQKMGGFFLAMILPMMIGIWAAVGGMYTAIDVAAGEKERGTLEALVVAPPSRRSLVFGKYLAVLTVSTITVVIVIVSMLAAIKIAGPAMFARGGGKMEISIPPASAALMLLGAFLLASIISALEIAVSIFARSFKEAQNYITPLYILVMVPGFLTQFTVGGGQQPARWTFIIPVLNALEVFKELLMGTVNWSNIGLMAASSLAYAIIALEIATRVFSREDVLFR